MTIIGARLRQLRNARNLTLKELAKALGTTPMTISRYENNQRQPDNEMLNKIANYFEVTTDFLLDRTNVTNYKNLKGKTLEIPVYWEYGISKDNKPEETFEVVVNNYDFVLNPDNLIGFRVRTNQYTPYFLNGDLLIVELTDEPNSYSQYYLAVLDKMNCILESISNKGEHAFFTRVTLEPRIVIKNPKIIGRILHLHRAL